MPLVQTRGAVTLSGYGRGPEKLGPVDPVPGEFYGGGYYFGAYRNWWRRIQVNQH